MRRVAVIGGGPAGMMAAIAAAEGGAAVTLYERNEKLGKKLYITGKGRCNVTNAARGEDFLHNIVRNPRFMRGALARFSNDDLTAFLERQGVPTVVERGGRVFPASSKASDVTRALAGRMEAVGVRVRLNTRVAGLVNEGGAVSVVTPDGACSFDACVLATGGLSYPQTGSTGDGYAFAERLGAPVTPRFPSLVQIHVYERWIEGLAGLTLKNVALCARRAGKTVFHEQGELLITHTGVSGPLALSLSAAITGGALNEYALGIDLKPALQYNVLDERLMRDFAASPAKAALRALDALAPRALAEAVVRLSGVEPGKRIAHITKVERGALCALLKALPLTVRALGGFDEAVVTRGGVDVRALSPSTLELKCAPGVFCAGELIDVDALTGGFNLQIAFSTGFAAGRAAAGGGE